MSVEPLFHFNMPQLTLLLKRQAEQNPSASYFNVDILKVNLQGIAKKIGIPPFICINYEFKFSKLSKMAALFFVKLV